MFNFLRMTVLFVGVVLGASLGSLAHAQMASDVDRIAAQWAELKYQAEKDPNRLDRTLALERETAALLAATPGSADLMYWRSNVLCFAAELVRSSKSLAMVREGRDLLLAAAQLQPQSSSIKASLGSIYYEVPGWPISFGNNAKAEQYLKEAVALDPDGMDSNFFMGDFLLQRGKGRDAIAHLEKAAAAAQRLPSSVLVDGRRHEIEEALEKARKKGG